MPDENRLAPGQRLRVTLLRGHILNALHVARPAARGCAACRQPWASHPVDEREPWPCERCGAEFSVYCYRDYVLSAEEPRETNMIFLCGGCRS